MHVPRTSWSAGSESKFRRTITLHGCCLIAFLLLAPSATAQTAQPVPKKLDAKVVDAWKKAGAVVGWYRNDDADYPWEFFREDAKFLSDLDRGLPAFSFLEFEPGVIGKLPSPSMPFALHLGQTNVKDANLKEFAGFKNLQVLDLNHTKVTGEGLTNLTSLKALQSLNLYNASIRDEGLESLAEFKNLRNLNLQETKITDEGLKAIGQLKTLRILNLRSIALIDDLRVDRLTDAGLVELAGLANLETLDLTSSRLTDLGLKKLSGLKNLSILRLMNTKVTDAGLKHLVGFKKLRDLSLTATQVTDAGVKDLAACKNLDTIWLFDTKISDAGFAQLRKLRPDLMILPR